MAQDHDDLESLRRQIKADSRNPRPYLERARAYLEEGEDFRARDVVVKRSNMSSKDPHIHAKWAELCEDLGMAGQARECYERALKIASHDSDILFRLARLLHDIGRYEDSIHYLKKAIKNKPAHSDARTLLAEDYEALGLTGRAEALVHGIKKKAPEPVRYFPPSVGREDVKKFLNLFSGREVGYGLQKISGETGAPFYDFIESPLSTGLIAKHLNGALTLSAYPLRMDNTVKYAAIAIRPRKRTIETNLKNRGYLAYLNERACQEALSLMALARLHGIRAYVDHDGEFGHRVWFFFSEFIHFLKAKDLLKRLLKDRPSPLDHLIIESLLGTKGVGVGWIEHPILLPLGLNLSTGKRILFLDEQGEPVEEQLKFLKRVRQIPFKEARAVLGTSGPPWQAGMPKKGSEPARRLIDHCPVLEELTEKAGSGRGLPHREKVILFYSFGILDSDGFSLHTILESCQDYNYEKVERQRNRLKSNPISCPKIRELVPEITSSVSCNCSFDLRGGKYPSPLLHVRPHLVPVGMEFEIPDRISPREAARRYINLKRQEAEIEGAMDKVAKILDAHYDRKGIAKIQVGKAALVRRQAGKGACWEIEVGS